MSNISTDSGFRDGQVQVARNVTMKEWGFLSPGQYLIHDRDTKFCAAFQQAFSVIWRNFGR
jgi:hypothetical protein